MRTDGRTDRHDEAITRFLQFLPARQKTSRSSAESAYDLHVKRQGYITITFLQVRFRTFNCTRVGTLIVATI